MAKKRKVKEPELPPSSEEEVEEEQSEEEEEQQQKGEEEAKSSSNSDDDSDSEDDENDDEEEEDVTALFKGVSIPQTKQKRGDRHQVQDSDDDGNSDDDDSDDDDSEGADEGKLERSTTAGAGGSEQCTFDLRNLLAVNTYQVSKNSLYLRNRKQTKSKESKEITIPLPASHSDLEVNEDFLLSVAGEGCAQLVHSLWELPIEKSDAGPLVTLPAFDSIRIPRALPPPPPKQETKWEKFAKEKGIPLNKEKRSRKVWDESTGTWMYRHGYEKANSKSKEWPIMEVKAGDDPYEDPWEKLRDTKRARTEKNLESRMRNEERAGEIPRGTTNRVLKSREHLIQQGKKGGNLDRDRPMMPAPVGVPVDLRPNPKDDGGSSSAPTKRGKNSTVAALLATQRSTASLGKFDKMREDEPERRKALSSLKRKKFESASDKKVLATESEKSMKILKAVVNGGVAKEKARKKGMLAKGETAYDYDYDDGLGASTFKKKKGRAGAGKMRKMTKKRAK